MQPIADSELILNNDGSIYHLNLLPEDISDKIINVGDPDRVSMVSGLFDSIELKKQKREFVTHTGIYKGKRISVISTGIGTDNIDIVYNELDALVNIDLKTRLIREERKELQLVRIGTSGALQADIGVDSFVCSTFGLGLDGLLNFYELENDNEEAAIISAFRNHFPNKGIYPESYLAKGSALLTGRLGKGMQQGITASCSGFYGPQMRQLRLKPSRTGMISQLSAFRYGELRVTNFEMETGAMYGLAKMLGHQCCAVNLIVANRMAGQFSKDYPGKMKELIELVLERI